MAIKGKNYSKKGRPAGTHCCRVCNKPLSGSRIAKGEGTCANCGGASCRSQRPQFFSRFSFR